jgi:hypothetical protein
MKQRWAGAVKYVAETGNAFRILTGIRLDSQAFGGDKTRPEERKRALN